MRASLIDIVDIKDKKKRFLSLRQHSYDYQSKIVEIMLNPDQLGNHKEELQELKSGLMETVEKLKGEEIESDVRNLDGDFIYHDVGLFIKRINKYETQIEEGKFKGTIDDILTKLEDTELPKDNIKQRKQILSTNEFQIKLFQGYDSAYDNTKFEKEKPSLVSRIMSYFKPQKKDDSSTPFFKK